MVEQGKLAGYGFESDKAGDFTSYKGNIWASPAYAWCTKTSFDNAMRLWTGNMISAASGKFPNRVN
jgi:hypothetical protein